MTRAEFMADTFWYVKDIVLFDTGSSSASANPLWEFGHLLWRPLGWVLFKCFGGLTSYMRTGEEHLAVTAVLVVFSTVCGFLAALIVQALAIRILDNPWPATLVSTSVVCSYAFLDYVHSGTAYIPGLLFLLIAEWLTIRALDRDKTSWRYGLLIGFAAGIAALFWFPYILGIPGILATAYLWDTPRSASARRRWLWMAYISVFFGILIASGYLLAILALQIHSIAGFKAWFSKSSHGWAQTRRLVRMISGLPRAFLYMGDDGIKLKQYLVKDPYARITLLSLLKAHVWKLGVFYAFSFSLIWILARSSKGRRMLGIFAAGALPVLLFAAFLFESGSPERYFPLVPFLGLSLAFALSRFPKPLLGQVCIVGFLGLVITMNTAMLSRGTIDAKARKSADRVRSLQGKVNPAGMVALPTLGDDIYQFTLSFPFDLMNRKQTLPVYDVIENGTVRVATWRQEFARHALQTLKGGESVWISKRLLAERPEPAWKWTEGDDTRISWKGLRPVFLPFYYSEDTGGTDGFLKLANSPENIKILQRLMKGS